MNYIKLGSTNIAVSKLCVGCMSFGDSSTHFHDWTLNYEESEKIIKRALNLGLNFLIRRMCIRQELAKNI